MNRLTVKDVGGFRKRKPKLRGARIDFRWDVRVPLEDRELFLTSLIEFLRNEDLTMSGFGDDSYSGIISADVSLSTLKRKLIRLTQWHRQNSDKFNLFRTGKIQWVDDIYFE